MKYRASISFLSVFFISCLGFSSLLVFSGYAQADPVHLAWDTYQNANHIGYFIYRSAISGGPYTRLNDSVCSSVVYSDYTVKAGEIYYYTITAVNQNGLESRFSREIKVSIPFYDSIADKIPFTVQAVSGFTATAGQLVVLSAGIWNPEKRDLSISWNQNSGPTVLIHGKSNLEAQFLAPDVLQNTRLEFTIVAKEIDGLSVADILQITVQPR